MPNSKASQRDRAGGGRHTGLYFFAYAQPRSLIEADRWAAMAGVSTRVGGMINAGHLLLLAFSVSADGSVTR